VRQVEQNLRELFDRALDDEPAPRPGGLAAAAMADGGRLRRRRNLRLGGAAGLAAVAVIVGINLGAPPSGTVQRAALPEATACVSTEQAANTAYVLLSHEITGAQRQAVERSLRADPRLRNVTHETREQAFVRFAKLWRDEPDFVKSVGPQSLPESFVVELVRPDSMLSVAHEIKGLSGVDDVIAGPCYAVAVVK
jgi:cell division transport system permease protein